MYQQNVLANALRAGCAGYDDAPFVNDRATGQITTYGQIWRDAEKVAGILVALGVLPGDRVATQIEKSTATISLYLGTVLCGAVYLPMNPAYKPAEVAYFLNDAGPRVFVCDPGRKTALEPIAADAGVVHVLTMDADGLGSLAAQAAQAAPLDQAVARGPDDLAAILYTSGTTGRSKGAMLSHENLRSNAQVLRDLWQFTRDDVLIHALPLFHTHGLFVAINVTLMAGGAMLFHRSFDAAAVLDDFAQATAIMGVPTFYTRLLDQPGLSAEATANMRLFISGSAPMLADTHARWHARTGHQVLERYGMTETSMSTSNPYEGTRKPGTVGLPLPGVDLRVVDETGAVAAPGAVGGVEVRGPNVFKGYWQMPDKTAEDMRADGWFHTGDLGQLDNDGYLTIVGRSKDLVISGGYNIYPKEIETAIDALAGVIESAAFGVPDPDLGEVVGVAVVLAPDATLSADDILSGIAETLARFKQPRHVHFLDALPRNTMGKVQKNQLRQDFAAG